MVSDNVKDTCVRDWGRIVGKLDGSCLPTSPPLSSAHCLSPLPVAVGGSIQGRARPPPAPALTLASLSSRCVCVCVANYELRCTKPCIGKNASHSSSGLITKTCRMPLMRWLQLRFDCNSTALRPFDNQRYDLSAALRPRLINRSA